jgi:hypothetical protein
MNDPSCTECTKLGQVLWSSYADRHYQDEEFDKLKKELEATKKELEATVTKLTQAESIITAKFNVKESVMSLLNTEEGDSFNEFVIEKHPCGRVKISITETKELIDLRGKLREKDKRKRKSENLIFLLQKFLKELRTTKNDELIRNMTKEEINSYLHATGWDGQLRACSMTENINETEWDLLVVQKEQTAKVMPNNDTRDQKRSRKLI